MSFSIKFVLIASFLSLFPLVSCFPNGAGTCVASVATVMMMSGSQNTLTGFSLSSASTSYVPGGASVSVTITSTTAAAPFTGFLIYATAGGTKVGTWSADPNGAAPNWQIGSVANNACPTDTAVITHTNSNTKIAGAGGTVSTFSWIPPTTAQGPVTFNLVVMNVNSQFQVNNAALSLTGPTPAPTASPPPTSAKSGDVKNISLQATALIGITFVTVLFTTFLKV